MWKGGERKVRTESTYGFAVSRANPARNDLGVCPAHLKTNTPGFRPGVPVFRYAESIPNVSEALRRAGRARMTKTYVRRGGRDRAPALRPSAVGRSRRATTSFLLSPSLPHRRASLRPVGDHFPSHIPPSPTLPAPSRRSPQVPSPARTTDVTTASTGHRRPPAHPFKLDALGARLFSLLGWVWARGWAVEDCGKVSHRFLV